MPRGNDARYSQKQVHMTISSVAGHIFESDFDESVKQWHSCDPGVLLSQNTTVKRFVPEVMYSSCYTYTDCSRDRNSKTWRNS